MTNKILSLILASAAVLSVAAQSSGSILSLKEQITDNAIVYPESFETNTDELMKNWYISNYTVLDTEVDKTKAPEPTDEVLIQRLRALPTVIEMPFNQVVKSYIVMYTERKRQLVETMLGMSLYYMPIFEQALEKEGLPLELKYLPVIESALNPNAVSRVGATGLWQFMLPTAKNLGLEVNSLVDERRNPYLATEKAAQYLKQLYGIYGDWSLAIAAYNCGPGNVNKALRRAGDENGKDFWAIYPFLPRETRGYVPAFIAANYVMTYFKNHGISPALAKRPLITDTIHVSRRVHLQQIADVLDIPLDAVQVLNPQFRKNIIPGDTHAYILALPSQQIQSYIMSEDSIVAHNAALYARRDVVEPATLESYNGTTNGEMEAYTKEVTQYHTVKRGETLSKIANRYGVTVNQIKKWNNLKTSKVARGKSLKIHTKTIAYRPIKKKVQTTDEEESESAEANRTTEMATAGEVVNDSLQIASSDIEAIEPGSSETAAETTIAEPVQKKSTEAKDTAKSRKDEAIAASKAKKEATEKKVDTSKSTKGTTTSKNSAKSTSDKKKAAVTHVVKKGETLFGIARNYPGVSAQDIQAENKLSGSKISIGQKLRIPAPSK